MAKNTWTQERRLLEIETSLGKDKVQLTSLDGREAISELFSYEIEMLSTDDDISAESMIGDKVTLWLMAETGKFRPIHGMVAQWRAGPVIIRDLRQYRAQVVPWPWYLGHSTDCRIFQNLSVPEIVEQVFKTFGFTDYEMSLARGEYPKLEFCVQYRETALNFVSRLMEEVGIFYFFRHEESRHVMVIADKNASFKPLPQPELVWHSSNAAWSSLVTGWEHSFEFRPGKWAQRDYNFETPSSDLTTNEKTLLKLRTASSFERFDYPGQYLQKGRGTQLTKTLMQVEEAAYHSVLGASTYTSLRHGPTLHPQPSSHREGILRLRDHQRPAHGDGHQSPDARRQRAVPIREQLRGDPPRRAIPAGAGDGETLRARSADRRRRRSGRRGDLHRQVRPHQSAVPLGPAGQEGREQLVLRAGGAELGRAQFRQHLPAPHRPGGRRRLRGRQSRPAPRGRLRVQRRAAGPLRACRTNKTQSGLRTRSSLGGDAANCNELMFEDRKGSELVKLHAEKDLSTGVEHDATHWVGHDETTTIDNDRTETVHANETITIDKNRTETVHQNETVTIDLNRVHTVGVIDTLTVGAARLHSVGAAEQITVGAAQSITVGGESDNVGGRQPVDVGREGSRCQHRQERCTDCRQEADDQRRRRDRAEDRLGVDHDEEERRYHDPGQADQHQGVRQCRH